jgi:hypothetical protein
MIRAVDAISAKSAHLRTKDTVAAFQNLKDRIVAVKVALSMSPAVGSETIAAKNRAAFMVVPRGE